MQDICRRDIETAAGGEISVLDPGGYGAVTTTKSISIINDYSGEAGILASGTNGATVNAGASDIVILRGLVIDGGTPDTLGMNCIRFLAGGALHVEKCLIKNFVGTDPNGHASTSCRQRRPSPSCPTRPSSITARRPRAPAGESACSRPAPAAPESPSTASNSRTTGLASWPTALSKRSHYGCGQRIDVGRQFGVRVLSGYGGGGRAGGRHLYQKYGGYAQQQRVDCQ